MSSCETGGWHSAGSSVSVTAIQTFVNVVGEECCEDSALAWVAEGVRVDVFRIRFGQYARVGLERFVASTRKIIVVFVATLSLTFARFIHLASVSVVVWEGICSGVWCGSVAQGMRVLTWVLISWPLMAVRHSIKRFCAQRLHGCPLLQAAASGVATRWHS